VGVGGRTIRGVDDDRRRWDERYAHAALGRPCPPDGLVQPVDLVAEVATHGRALDLACGPGRQAVWAALRGLEVDAFDVSPVAVEMARRLATDHGVARRVHATVHDADDGLPDHLADGYQLVVCQRFRDPTLYPLIPSLLAPGGIAVITVLSSVGHDGDAGPFHAAPGELTAAFAGVAGMVELASLEAAGEATVAVRRDD
jgi:SAM-dependent methyltransferase